MTSAPATPERPSPSTHREYSGRPVTVMGLGSFGGGLGAARYLARLGCRVLVTDQRPAAELSESLAGLQGLRVELALGGHRREDFERTSLVVANPAVKADHPLLAVARSSGARVTSATELFLEAVNARLVCVTGTQGKSSTCHVLAELLRGSGRNVHLGGNIGGSLLDGVENIAQEDVCVLELSSYQLAALADPVAPRSSVEAVAVTNVLADHLETHGSWAAYAAAKRRILALLADDGVAFLPYDPRLADWAPRKGRRVLFSATRTDAPARIENGAFRLDGDALGSVEDLRLPGLFQRENALVALGLARALGADPDALSRTLPRIRGLAHRLELLGRFRGRRVLDNGVSTTPDSTVAALRSVPPGGSLLVGGRSKGLSFDDLATVVREREVAVFCFGEARDELAAALADGATAPVVTERLEDAVTEALERTPPGADVLFSPACASFDAYPNFRARALAFRAALPDRDDDEPAEG